MFKADKVTKILIVLICFAAVISAALAYGYSKENSQPDNNGARLEVDFLDVGQGDGILIKTPYNQNILIDGGPDNSVVREISENLPFWNTSIDLMVLTHPHDDHVSGLIEVLKRYEVKKILATGVIHTTPNYLEWLNLIKEKNIPFLKPEDRQEIGLGDELKLQILYPRRSFYSQQAEDLNNTSIVLRLAYRQNAILFMGDAGIDIEKELLAEGLDIRSDVIKIGHHGSEYSSTEDFLEKVKPEIAVIEVGKNNYGHPSLRVVRRIERIGAKILRTDKDSTIKIVSDGRNIKQLDE